ncbi:MAG TPA: alkaline phosphatase family protein [Candidatus Acidoferrales bacterium]|nr:alkaline phosphatase family protein [Candidatus Acidoferrales bacterium]
MTQRIRSVPAGLLAVAMVLAAAAMVAAQQPSAGRQTRTVVLIVSDGLRWQEVFRGADPLLMNSKNGGIWAKAGDLKRAYWRDDVGERRAVLFPFLWGVVAKQGQLYGNQSKGSIARVTNGLAFSYPGYNEMLTGAPDPRINSNEYGPNPNISVFEWLNTLPEFRGHVAVFATWAAFRDIFNVPRSHLDVHAGWDAPYPGADVTPREKLLDDLYLHSTRLEDDDTYNSFLQAPLLDYVKSQKPRALFVGYGETDNWAHSGRYDLVLESAHQFDHFVAELWNAMQQMPEYRGQTTFVITTDHGRGSGPVEWKEHGTDEKGSENIWLAVIGPDTPALGERSQVAAITQSQIAATIAALVGEDFRSASPRAAPPIPGIAAAR